MAGEQIPNNLLLHEILEEQARRLSENVALEFHPDVKMTFGKLNREANRLARYLKERKTLDSEVIAVCFEKSPQLIVSIIAILKAGMAWVPIPTDAPAARISSILSACGARFALCFGPARHIVEGLAPVIVLDDVLDDADFLAYPDTNLAGNLKPSDLCQILFTSGSTGVPKGVAIEHRAMMHCVWGMVNEFGLTAKTRTLQFSAPTFDAFTLDVFMSIACGGCLVMATPSTMLADMTVFVRNSRATYAHITPTVLDMIDPLGVPEFETLSSTGEALSENLANRWRTRVRLFNSYGPTETLVCTIQYLGGNRIDSSCIGKAVPGLEVCLLEPGESNEVASGNVGEICVAGPHLFRGYVSAEKLSKGQLAKSECFRNGTRYYRTGDMGKMEACPGGGHTLRYLGRRDSQVKIHGIRTDLSDIERSITACEAFQNCIVVLPRSGPSQGRVCCLFTLRPSSTAKLDSKPQNAQCLGDSVELLSACGICASALRRGQDVAAAKLPTHALPTSWWAVKEFPRTSSGKVDRVKLRSLLEGLEKDDYIQHLSEISRTAQVQSNPPDIVEKQLLSLWADVLDRPMSTIDKTVSFTQFGADSLDVIRLISKARAQGLDLDIPQIYASKTIQQLARVLEPHLQLQATARKSVYRPFSAIPIDRPLGLLMQNASTVCQIGVEDIEDIFGTTQYQTGLMSLDLKSPGTYVCEFSWTLLKEIKIENFCSSWEALIADEPVLRSRLIWDETRDGLWQVVVRHREVSWSEEYFAASMSLGDDLCRGFLMLNRLRAMYVGEDTQPPRRLSFAEFMCHRIEDESLKRESSPRFWSKYLEACTQLHFPPSPPETHHEVHATGHQSLEITGSFKETAASFGVTRATLLYASVALLLSVNADSEDVTFGLILTGRDSPLDGIFDMIGPAFTIFPLRAKVAGSTTMKSFLKLIESHITNIIPHQNYGLQRIRQCGEGAARACDFRCLVIVQPEDENLAGKGLWEEVHGQTSGHADSVPLTLELILYDGKILVNCSFDSAFLCEEDVNVLLSQLGHALKHLETSTSRDELLVSQVKLDGQDEQLRFTNWAKRYGASVDSCLHELCFDNLEHADRVAIDDQGTHQQITYQELDAFSSRLRNHIQLHHPIAPETIVPVVLNKSPLAIITILAVLKAGGAYVPIDSNWPIRRVQHIIKETGASLKILITAGEMIRPSLIRTWSQRVRLLNAYGSTETSIVTSITDPISPDVSPTNIGLNVAAWHWIVRRDSTGAIYSVPRGCVGEIAVTGLTLARGYVNNPGLTERRFVEAPHLTVGLATSRVYLTGDIGKYTADGCICLLGRNDQMVKVNGIRVEPGESEQQLQQHGGIFASCAVQWLQDEQSNAKLAAFVPINSAKSDDSVASVIIAVEEMTQTFRESCRRAQLQLQDLLPVQYIPTLFIPIRRIPRTTSGKVDLKLLKARLQELPSFSGLFCVNKGQKQPTGEPPSTLAEIALESSFRQIFGNKQQYHTNVDFFALGGDSFSSIKLVSAARKHGWEISVQQVYRHPRLRDLAAVASLARKHHKVLPAFCMVNNTGLEYNISIAAEKCGVKEAQILDLYPCTAMQEALMISSTKSSGGFFDQQVFQLADGTSSETLITALQSVWARHAILRTRIILDDEYRSVQVVVQEKLEIDQVTNQTLAEYLRKDAALIPGYGDKLSRCATLSCTSGVFLVISQHHTIYDAWSMNLVLADIKHQYLATNVSRELPPAFSSFIHYVTELRKAPEAQNFWRQYLKGSIVTALPQVRMGEPFEGNQKYSTDIQLPIHDRHSLATMAEAAWGLLLCRYTGLENVTFGCVRTGRSAPIDNIDAIVGPTIVTVPRRVSAPHGKQVSSYLEQIEASIVDSIPWEQYGHRNIRKLSSGAHNACQFNSLLVVQLLPSELEMTGNKILIPQTTEDRFFKDDCLTVVCQPQGNRLEISITYDDRAVAKEEIAWISHNFARLLSELTSKPHQQVQQLDLVGPQGTQQVQMWNESRPIPAPARIGDMFSERARKWSSLNAINASDAMLTYADLDKLSSELAIKLGMLGVGKGNAVPLLMSRSAVAIVCMLAILKAGAAYIPLAEDSVETQLELVRDKLGVIVVLCAPEQYSKLLNYPVKVMCYTIEAVMREQYPTLP
ncbi:nonribosomal peptide synthetase [Cordyceps javanica]|uniref:Nonribosomal peptide synthetase n=1 Tax=Cordyceps javanica TaxID=43265 RepID=A0A545UN60_9HYPO|nr:nonribosomal peptide synthetase [Cordyceps javanica]TQW02642.1 nonribosomal peptide synthetase [Cordyceps javanica]